MKPMRTVKLEIEDTLPERVENVIEELEHMLREYVAENPDKEEFPCLHNDLDYNGAFHELVDSSVPVYTSEIKDIMYLHGDEIEDAFDDAGLGEKEDDKWPVGWKPAAISCYLQQQASCWYENCAKQIFEEARSGLKPERN